MAKYKEFQFNTYLNLENGQVLVTLPGVLKWIVNSSASKVDTTKNWDEKQLRAFLKKEGINPIVVSRKDCILAEIHNNHHETKFYDEKADSQKEISFLDSKMILKLIKLIQKGNKRSLQSGKEYKEVMFTGFYLNLTTGLFYFSVDYVVRTFIANPFSSADKRAYITGKELENVAKHSSINGIQTLRNSKIEFQFLPKEMIANLEPYRKIYNLEKSKYLPESLSDATRSTTKVIDSEGLLRIYFALNDPKNQITMDRSRLYQQVSQGTVSERIDFEKTFTSLEAIFEIMQNTKKYIPVTKKAIEKQANKMILDSPERFEKRIIADKDITLSSDVQLPHSKKGIHKETYFNKALTDSILNFYGYKYIDNLDNFEPELKESLDQVLRITNKTNITLDDINAADKRFCRYKDKVNTYITKEVTWLQDIVCNMDAIITLQIVAKKNLPIKSKIEGDYLQTLIKLMSEGIYARKYRCNAESSAINLFNYDILSNSDDILKLVQQQREGILKINKKLSEIAAIKKDIDQIKLRTFIFNELNSIDPSLTKELKSEDRKLDYQQGINIPTKDIEKFDQTFSKRVNKILEKLKKKILSVKKEHHLLIQENNLGMKYLEFKL